MLVVSDHMIGSPAKATIHFLAEELAETGREVKFLTTGFSWASTVRGDPRAKARKKLGPRYRLNQIDCSVPRKLLHPQNFHNSVINASINPWYERYGRSYKESICGLIDNPSCIIIETGYSIALYHQLKRAFPRAKIVYWVSDDPKALRMHPLILKIDREMAEQADLVVCVSLGQLNQYPRGFYIERGISTKEFDRPQESPFSTDRRKTNVICVGTMLYDRKAVEQAAAAMPSFEFHIIGPKKTRGAPPNVKYYGMIPFLETIKFIQHCDIGLAPYFNTPGIGYISGSSLKISQYTYCKKPVVCPEFAAKEEAGFYPYAASDAASLAKALKKAAHGLGSNFDSRTTLPWTQVVRNFLDALE